MTIECCKRLQNFVEYCSEKFCLAGSSNIVFQALGYSQVLYTSTDPSQKFSAPFKAGNSRQVQTCYIL